MANLWTWYRAFERERHAFRRLEVTQVVSTFNIEFREAEASDVRTLAYIIEPRVVLFILATKLFSDLSSVDLALGLVYCLFKLFRDCRYMWISPFTETHVGNCLVPLEAGPNQVLQDDGTKKQACTGLEAISKGFHERLARWTSRRNVGA